MEENTREVWFDAAAKASATFVDATGAARELAQAHLCGPASAYFLAKAAAAAALLAAETSEEDEVVSVQMKCDGPLGGFNVECSAGGAIRGYTEKKILDDFDACAKFDEKKIVGERRIQVTRSVPGRIISQGISNSLDGYLAGSLQRRARIFLEAAVGEGGEVLEARGALVEALPDGDWPVSRADALAPAPRKTGALAASPRTLLKRLGLAHAQRREVSPLRFECRCSGERAAAILAAMPEDERRAMPDRIDVTCHMCGKTWTVENRK